MPILCLLCKRIIKVNKILLITILFTLLSLSFALPRASADQISLFIEQASQKYGISDELIAYVIEVESGFNPYAVSRCNARGLMQITKGTWDWICRDYLQVSWDFEECAFDTKKNIEVGTRFLKWIDNYLDSHMYELNDTKQNLTLACYNAGPQAVRKSGYKIPPIKETQNYVKKINRLFSNI